MAAQDDFGTCEVDVLISIIQMDDLAIYDEMTVFHCLVKWIEAQEDPNENLVRQVFSYVRFPMMTPRQLADLLLCSLTQRYKEFFVERMAIAMAFHSGECTPNLTETLTPTFATIPNLVLDLKVKRNTSRKHCCSRTALIPSCSPHAFTLLKSGALT